MAETNIILGYGETLTSKYPLNRGSGEKKYPYSIDEQRAWLQPQFVHLLQTQHQLSEVVKPRGESVAKFTLHPTFLAKSHHPNGLFVASGLRCIGSKSVTIQPRKVTTKDAVPTPTFTAELFVAGHENSFIKLSKMLESTKVATHLDAFRKFELVSPFAATDKIFISPTNANVVKLEVALHASLQDKDILNAFSKYVEYLGGAADIRRSLSVAGLTFVPIQLSGDKVEPLAEFSFVRVLRTMPSLRIGGRTIRSLSTVTVPDLPEQAALDTNLRVGVFDGGIGHGDLSTWVMETILPGTETTSSEFLSHGNGVTSALLFGPLHSIAPNFTRPYSNIEHFRVISPSLLKNNNVVDIDLYDVLSNIDSVLKTKKFDFVNFSIGPYMPMEDNEVHPWTALIDHYLADGETFASVAVGNDGDKTWPESRIQPPSDMVNAVAIGACDSRSEEWQRAAYSSHGPGRSPGMVKPDGLAFGGSDKEPFVLYNALTNGLAQTSGTSFGSPALLRTAIGVKASLNSALNILSIRALLTHHAVRPKSMPMSEVGYGRFPQTIDEILTCNDNEIRVIYQGVLEAGQNLRAFIPFPTLSLNGRVILRATLCFASQTDPEHAVNYTRAGLSVTFRPKKNSKKTMSFFSAAKIYTSELQARTHEQKWETTLKHEQRFQPDTLDDPLFDITYGAREEGQSVNNSALPPLPYAMVITVSVENTPGIYNNIRQRYQTLQPLRLRQEIQLKSKSGA
jgi:hypothetical protein